jgi:2-oxoglutarate dehydrogenase E2 component (dihydrolipoamide succinyltransferase)
VPEPAADGAGRWPTAASPESVEETEAAEEDDLAGTGVGGRIRKSDVLAAAERAAAARAEAAATAASASSVAPAASTPSAPVTTDAPTTQVEPSGVPGAARGRTEKMSRLRQTIAARMVESLHVSAQLTTVVEVDVTKIARLRDRAKAAFEAREGVKLSFLPFFAVATVEALKAHPALNASIDGEAKTITYHDAEHLGIAVDTERGLLAPVIHNAGDLNLSGLARNIADLAERTRTNKISPDELSGGTFTLTNTGSRGALFDTPIINQPQVGILGTGGVVKRPVVVSDPEFGETIAVRSMVYLALTYDHRVVDGADAARFLGTIKNRLEAGSFERALGLA